MPDAVQPTIDQKIDATNTSVARLAHKVDNLVAAGLAQRAAARMDSADRTKADDDAADAKLAKMVADAVTAALKAHDDRRDRRRHEDDAGDVPPEQCAEDPDGHEIEPAAADDDRVRDDRHHREDDRRHHRADAARRAQDDENDRLMAQQDYDRAFQATEGKRAPQPMMGQSARSYRLYCMKPLQKYSEAWKDVALDRLPADAFALADKQIRADAIRIGSDPGEMQKYEGAKVGALQREIIKIDRTGRRISEFVGPVDAENGMFAPFALPPRRVVRINRNPNKID
jgi:hypothetical protein